MKWYFCFNERVSGWFGEMIKVCVTSNALYGKLEAHCIYHGRRDNLTDWLERNGVTVHFKAVSFLAELNSSAVIEANTGTAYDPEAAAGFYLPLEIAHVETTDDFVLFTDVDVMFMTTPDLSTLRPHTLAACGEVMSVKETRPGAASGSFNSGVMVLNIETLRRDYAGLVDVARGGAFFSGDNRGVIYDQWMLNAFYADRWDRMNDGLNWRAFWSADPEAEIVHFHGPKPIQIKRFLAEGGETEGLTGDILTNNQACYVGWLARYDAILRNVPD